MAAPELLFQSFLQSFGVSHECSNELPQGELALDNPYRARVRLTLQIRFV